MKYTKVTKKDFNVWLDLGLLQFKRYNKKQLVKEFKKILNSKNEESFLCWNSEGEAIAFANFSLRKEHVPGAKSSPVGYVEGCFYPRLRFLPLRVN